MKLITDSFTFPKAKKTGGPRVMQKTVVFDQDFTVGVATACLNGFEAEYSDFAGHSFGMLRVQLGCTWDKNTVTVSATYGLRDNKDDWDKEYEGTVYFAVLAEKKDGAN